MIDTLPLPLWSLLAAALGLLALLGISLIVSRPQGSPSPGMLGLTSLLIAIIGYAASGFALHFGGIGILIDHPDVARLVWEWTPLQQGDLARWGMAGWMGFGLADAQTPLAALLFLTALPLVATASMLALYTLWRQLSPAAGVFMAAMMALLLAPLVGNWVQAGGWLMHLGESIGAGDGYLDFGGASFFLLAGGVALAALVAFRGTRRETIAADSGAMAALGAGLLAVGGMGWIIASPLHLWGGSSPIQGVLNGLLALAAGGLIGLAYSWVAWGAPEMSWLARSAAAGWTASLAAIPWMSPWQAMLIGAVAAWVFILSAWLIDELLGWRDPGAILATFGVPALWGLLAVGFIVPSPGQFQAQGLGVLSIFLLAFFPTSIFLVIVWLIGKLLGKNGESEEQETSREAISDADVPIAS